LIVRQDVDHAQPTTTIIVDVRPAGYSPESFELAIDFAASIIETSLAGRSPFRLKLTNGASVSGESRKAANEAMELLTQVTPRAAGSIQSVLTHVGREHGGAVLVVLTGVIEKTEMQFIANMRVRFSRVVIVSVTPEPQPPKLFTGISVIQGSNESELIAAWNNRARP